MRTRTRGLFGNCSVRMFLFPFPVTETPVEDALRVFLFLFPVTETPVKDTVHVVVFPFLVMDTPVQDTQFEHASHTCTFSDKQECTFLSDKRGCTFSSDKRGYTCGQHCEFEISQPFGLQLEDGNSKLYRLGIPKFGHLGPSSHTFRNDAAR